MPYYVPPRSDAARLAMLQQTAVRVTQEGIDTPLPEAIITQLNTLLPQFKDAYNIFLSETNERIQQVAQGEAALAQLQMYIRHLWSEVKNRMIRESLPATVHAYYALTTAGDLPAIDARQDCIAVAEQIIAGDAQAIDAGYKPALSPTAQEVEAVLQRVRQESEEVLEARNDADKALLAVQQLRPDVDKLLKKVVASLQYHYQDLTPSQVRNKVRSYGGSYQPYEGEQLDESEA